MSVLMYSKISSVSMQGSLTALISFHVATYVVHGEWKEEKEGG